MQTLNLHDNNFSDFNAFKVFESAHSEKNKRGIALMEQLQTTLELDSIISKFAMEASKYINFSGLYFKGSGVSSTLRGSRQGKIERQFELNVAGEHLGILSYSVNRPLTVSSTKILDQLHQYLIYPLRNAINYKQAILLAMQDGLTGLGNRRYFDEQLKRAMHHAKRHNYNVGLVVCDLNKFKAINDTYGHSVGDNVLVNFAKALKECLRDSDSVFRFGGDEFALLIEHAGPNSLAIIHNRIEQAVAKSAYLTKYQVGCSIGSTFMNTTDTEQSFFERADQALYHKKLNKPRTLSIV